MPGFHYEPNLLDRNGLCLLSLDGGGVRGLSTLFILQDIMTQLSRERGSPSILKPCEVFDLIGGTSTGGLIAIMLGRLEMSTVDCILAYTELIRKVFGEKLRSLPVNWIGDIRPRYDSEKLRSAVEDVIKKAGAAPEDQMNDRTSRRCRVFVCTTAKDTLQVTRIRSYSVPNEDTVSATICESALATSAATGFFRPVTIGNSQYVDGAFGANNPVEEVEEEAADIWCTSSRDLKPLLKCFLSLGTGNPLKMPMDDNIIKFLSKTLVRMATKPESTERRFMARWSDEARRKRIFRFNVEQGLQGVHMSDYQKLSLIETATQDYLHHVDQKSRIRDCTFNLAGKEALQQSFSNRDAHQIAPGPHKSPLWLVPFERNPGFVNRELLDLLKRKLFSQVHSHKVSIFGLGGIGKTQIVLELAHQTREMYPDCSILWIPAMDLEQLQQAYIEIAHQLGIEPGDGDETDMKVLVQSYLSRPENGKWLLIIDNADDVEMWTGSASSLCNIYLRQTLPQGQHGRIVFTTRSLRLAQHLASGNIIEVQQMEESRAIQLLGNALVNKALLTGDKEKTRSLLESLAFLPLAIIQAATFMNVNQITVSRYIEILEGHEQGAIDLLSEEFEDQGRYQSARNPIASTWLTSFQQIQETDPVAADCLAFLSCVSASDIPTCLLPVYDEVKREKAIGLLKSYSFVRGNNNGERLNCHRLVQIATSNWLRSNGLMQTWQKKSLECMAQRLPYFEMNRRSDWRAAVPHALRVLQRSVVAENLTEAVNLMSSIACCYQVDGRYQEAKSTLIKLQSLNRKHYNTHHRSYLKCQSLLAHVNFNMGNHEESIRLFESAIEGYKEAGMIKSPDAMNTMSRFSITLLAKGSLQRAEELGSQALRWNLSIEGPYSFVTLEAIYNMTVIYSAQGRLSDAEHMAQQCLQVTRKSLGPDHVHLISTISSLGYIYMRRWKLSQAEDMYLDALERCRRIYGPDNRATLDYLYQLALVRSGSGQCGLPNPFCCTDEFSMPAIRGGAWLVQS
ncbi:Uncharacterized protein PECH_005178 [Penicillium ucsense]|uniref:PNPLA domain-containing protein n=1 Tax=Penicillium ucsense TaxID=2839758 RepID=A0A8J8W760_9EURO|nr:Uncharacterized protein PECM_005412 [Penicillium ucsense]KAF7736551.1 Uncharacterized protein PECH_005178 [Penicillium ucsense]